MNTPPAAGDDERTIMPEGKLADGHATAGSTAPTASHNALRIGTRLGEFEITGLVGEGGFGIVYLVYDHSLERTVAIKEYMPSALATRASDTTVVVKSSRHADTFKAGLRSFINEARLLAQFDHPALLKVYRFWEANGTAYMVMPFYEAPTLKQALAERERPPDENWLKGVILPLLDALEVLHQAQCFHRDIAPDNILLLKGNLPLLLDFGAARRVIGDMNQALTVIVKAGYAPLEQYAENPSMRQGPWTDLYALASVIYFAIMGQPPMPALARMRVDQMVPLATAAAGRYSDTFLRALDAALAVEPEGRPQSVADFRRLLKMGDDTPPSRQESSDAHVRLRVEGEDRYLPAQRQAPRKKWAIAGVTLLVAIALGFVAWRALQDKPPVTTPAPPAPPVVVGTSPPAGAAPPTVVSTVPPPISGTTPPVVDTPPPVPATPPPFVEATTPPPVVDTKPSPIAIDPQQPFSALRALKEVYDGRDALLPVTVDVEKPTVRIGKDYLRFGVTSARNGYVYVLVIGTTGSDFLMLFPNSADRNNRIAAGKPLALPRSKWPMRATGPAGTDHFVVIVSEEPRDFTMLRMQRQDIFDRFLLDHAAKLYRGGERPPLFAGRAACPATAKGTCPDVYGAAEFAIQEVTQ